MRRFYKILVALFIACEINPAFSNLSDILNEPRGLLYKSMAHPERERLRPEVRLRNILASKFINIAKSFLVNVNTKHSV